MKSSKPALVKNTTPNNYIQHDLNKIMYLIKLSDNLLAAKIYFYIIYKADGKDALIVSNTFFSEYFKTSISSVRRAVQILEMKNILIVKKRKGMAVYILNACFNDNSNIEMDCNVIFTKEEWGNSNVHE